MFYSSHIHTPNLYRHRNALRTFFPSSSSRPPDSKKPLRRGILFSVIAAVLLLVGAILTWLGFSGVFGSKITMAGPLLIAFALLMLLLSLRQFMLAKKKNRTANGPVQMETMNSGDVAQVAADQDDINGTAIIVVGAWDSEEPNTDPIPNADDLVTPSYTDVAQSFNSNSPSFFSHDDHNEAPPTYEETCAGIYPYTSESSPTQLGSQHGSAQFDRFPSPCRTGQDYFFQNDTRLTYTSGMQNDTGFTHTSDMQNDIGFTHASGMQNDTHLTHTSGMQNDTRFTHTSGTDMANQAHSQSPGQVKFLNSQDVRETI